MLRGNELFLVRMDSDKGEWHMFRGNEICSGGGEWNMFRGNEICLGGMKYV